MSQIVVDTDVASYIFNGHSLAPSYIVAPTAAASSSDSSRASRSPTQTMTSVLFGREFEPAPVERAGR